MINKQCSSFSDVIRTGIEDKFSYTISDSCVMCGKCAEECPVNAIAKGCAKYEIDPQKCMDCGFCSAVCPVGAVLPAAGMRESIPIQDMEMSRCYFNPGCALSLYKPKVPKQMLRLLRENFGNIKLHDICCRNDPCLETGAVIINNCAGCDRRFRSLYEGIRTISYWEVIDGIVGLKLPDYTGLTVSVHDSCGYRHRPQVHRAVRSILKKMHIEIAEAGFSGTKSICCGDNLYGAVPNEQVKKRIQMRADQFPCRDVVVYCIGCVRSMKEGGRIPHYLPDLLFGHDTEPMPDTLDEYHSKLMHYIALHGADSPGLSRI
ncbi:MAG: 4Fe-4S binding protein [Lachnospiraceae bacterium]|nr:4Fe-4S binding protein [Lachnospiraceae bacterium]